MPDLDKAESYRTWADLRDMLNDLVRASPSGFRSASGPIYITLYFFSMSYISLYFLQFPLYPGSQWPYIAYIPLYFLACPIFPYVF